MKKFSAVLLMAATLTAGVAHAHSEHHTAVYKSSVSYKCDQGRTLKVNYGFNKQNLPVYASANLNGKTRYMPINLNRSDRVDTIFGDENNFKLSTSEMTRANHRKQAVMVTAPGQSILFKNCTPRR